MKKTNLAYLFITVYFLTCGDISAQSFLKKLGKGIENVSKKIDETVKVDETVKASDVEVNSPKMTISTPHKNLQVNLLGAEWKGNEFSLEFTITNIGDDIKGYCLIDANGEKTMAFDNLGNQCYATILFGNSKSRNNGYAENTLLNGVPVKVIVIITKFGANASSFSQIKIGAGTDIWNITNHFIFKNVPIIKNEEIEVSIPVKEVGTQNNENNSPNKLTDNNTPLKQSVEKPASSSIKIPETKFGMTNWSQAERNKYSKAKRISQQERLLLKIDNIKDNVLNRQLKNNQLVRGKSIFKGQKGQIESLIIAYDYPGEGQEFSEYIISYDSNGNYVSHLLVGGEKLYYTNDISAVLKDSTITVTLHYADAGDEDTIITKYRISSDLKISPIK